MLTWNSYSNILYIIIGVIMWCVCHCTGVRDDDGDTPLDKALDGALEEELIEDEWKYACKVPLYLINRGCGSDKDKARLLCGACLFGDIDIVRELVEKHKIDPNGESESQYVQYNKYAHARPKHAIELFIIY